jgi:hypothetical protein
MTRYERAYGTDWDTLEQNQAVTRAYALGVAAALDEYHREELDAIRAEVQTAYDRSLVELAFEEGKNEGNHVETEREKAETVWNELVTDEIPRDPDELPTDERPGLPEAIDLPEGLALPDRDSTDALDLPEFLDNK